MQKGLNPVAGKPVNLGFLCGHRRGQPWFLIHQGHFTEKILRAQGHQRDKAAPSGVDTIHFPFQNHKEVVTPTAFSHHGGFAMIILLLRHAQEGLQIVKEQRFREQARRLLVWPHRRAPLE